MVYIKNWTDYESATTELYARSPDKVRYTVKFAPKTGQLVLKVTDDIKCLKYKSHSSIILNRFESLNLRLLSQMSNTRRSIPSSSARPGLTAGAGSGVGSDAQLQTLEREGTPAPPGGEVGSTTTTTTPGGQGKSAGGKKKKKGKK